MTLPLMPKATAVWLVDNTALTFEQIAAFCGLHMLEVTGIANGDVAPGMVGLNPVMNGQLTAEEIARCEADPDERLQMVKSGVVLPKSRKTKKKYIPVSRRGDKPNAIAWLLKNHPELSDRQICGLIGTTKETITRIRDKTHWDATNIKAQDPILLGLISRQDLDEALREAGQTPSDGKKATSTVDYEDGDEEKAS